MTKGKKGGAAGSAADRPAEITFDREARREYLTGFHKRKVARIKAAQDAAAAREKEERLRERREVCRALFFFSFWYGWWWWWGGISRVELELDSGISQIRII